MTRAHKVLKKKKVPTHIQEQEEAREKSVVHAGKLLKTWARLRGSKGRAAARFQFRKLHGKSIAEACSVLSEEMMEIAVVEKLRYPA